MMNQLPECSQRGAEFAPSRWVCNSTRLIVPRGVTEEDCCGLCPLTASERMASLGHSPRKNPRKANYGVAIGTYDSFQPGCRRYGVEAVELNLAVLRANCGPHVRVLVCDDGSPAESRRRYRAVCRTYNAEFVSNRRRYGHCSGDIIVFWRALRWAHHHGLQTVTKLSQRMIFNAPNWVAEDSALLLASGRATMTATLANFDSLMAVRSEAVMMVVDRWYRADVLERYKPMRYTVWNEGHTFGTIRRLVDVDSPFPHFLPWHRLSYIRGADRPPTYFRVMSGDALRQFGELATKYGLRLSEHFSTIDSIGSADYVC